MARLHGFICQVFKKNIRYDENDWKVTCIICLSCYILPDFIYRLRHDYAFCKINIFCSVSQPWSGGFHEYTISRTWLPQTYVTLNLIFIYIPSTGTNLKTLNQSTTNHSGLSWEARAGKTTLAVIQQSQLANDNNTHTQWVMLLREQIWH